MSSQIRPWIQLYNYNRGGNHDDWSCREWTSPGSMSFTFILSRDARPLKGNGLITQSTTQSEELKWDEKSYKAGYWRRIWVRSSRLGRVKQLQLHPVPVDGDRLGYKTHTYCRCCKNQFKWRLEITSLPSRTGWTDWYIYKKDFQDRSMTIDLAAPK
jgi:hypothetical protein